MDNLVKFHCPNCEAELGMDFSGQPDNAIGYIDCPICDVTFVVSPEGNTQLVTADQIEQLMEQNGDDWFDEFMSGLQDSRQLLEYDNVSDEIMDKAEVEEALASVSELQANLVNLDDQTLVEEIDYISFNSEYGFPLIVFDTMKKFKHTGKLTKFERKSLENMYILTWAKGVDIFDKRK